MKEVFEKIKATDVDIIVEFPQSNKHDGRQPYYCIRYYDLADKQVHIGFGSYCLDYVLQWKEECFEIVENIKTKRMTIKRVSFYKGRVGREAYKACKVWKLGFHVFLNGGDLIFRVCYLRNKKGTHYIQMSVKARECLATSNG